MQGKVVIINDREFRRLWSAGLSRLDMAIYFRCSVSKIDHYREQLELQKRYTRVRTNDREPGDPTPEEIEERKAALRERHIAEMRGEVGVLPVRKWREQGGDFDQL